MLCVVAVGGVGYWSIQPNLVVLISDAESAKVDSVIDALASAGIDYQLSGAGGTLLVDSRDFAKAKLLARSKGVVSDADQSVGGLSSAFVSPSQERDNARIHKQRTLEATIAKLSVVDRADVHLNIPRRSPFERETSPPSASVLLTLLPGQRLTEHQAQSIAKFVAFAVEGLQPESVQITDKDGHSYNVQDKDAQAIASQVAYLASAEQKLARKAETQLLHFVGYGNANVEVSLDLTFTNGSTKKITYDPEGQVVSQEDVISETRESKDEAAQGMAGAASNLQTQNRGRDRIQSKTENIKTSYLVPQTEETNLQNTPTKNYMTVSVLVNSNAPSLQGPDGALLPGIEERVTQIVKNAVGFQEESDTISLEFLPFPTSEFSQPATPPFNWEQVNELLKNASLAIGAVLALIIGLLLLRRYQPAYAAENQDHAQSLDRGRSQEVSQLSELVRKHPEVFKQVVRSWAGGQREDSTRKAA